MSLNIILLLVATGLCAGFVAGTMGVGGAVIMVPAMVFFLGLTQHQAQGTSLAVLMFPVGILAVINYAKHGYVNFKYAVILIIVFVVGSYLGSLFAVNMPEKVLKKIFGSLIVIIGIKMLLEK